MPSFKKKWFQYYNTCTGVSGVRNPLSDTLCIAISNASSPVIADPSRIFIFVTSQGDKGCRNAVIKYDKQIIRLF